MATTTVSEKKQLAVITDIYENCISEPEALAKNNVPRWLYRRWLTDRFFQAECDYRLYDLARVSRALITNCLPHAAARLVALMASEKGETARKACLDLFEMNKTAVNELTQQRDCEIPNQNFLTDEEAGKILNIMANARARSEQKKA